ncbi:SLC16A14 [Acanthosepion pharaonis]|uniref:SLC16A14 n=1 Tax=Acanthosepion pharaonis TaxID=158019 RepID=A0A812DUK8_ACAPH|nr:SLC16A14 [Sepia pharaonis]
MLTGKFEKISNIPDETMDTEELNEKRRDSKLDETVVRDGGWAWVICFAAVVCNFLISGLNTASGILLVGMLNTFQESVTKTSMVFAMLSGVTMMISPLVSGFLSFYSHRQIIIAGSLLGSFTVFASAFVSSIDLMIFTFGFVGGCSLGMIIFAVNVIVGLYFKKKRGLAVGLANAGAGMGFILNLVVFGALCRPLKQINISSKKQNTFVSQQNEENDLDPTAIAEQIDDEREDMLKKYQAESSIKKESPSHINGRCLELGKSINKLLDFSVLKNANAMMLVIIFFLWSANQVVMVYLPFYSINVGLSTADGALMMSVSGIGLTVGELLSGVLLDILHVKSDHLMTFSMICMGFTTIAIPFFNDVYSLSAFIVFWSIAVGVGVSLRVLLIVDLLGVENLAPVYSFVLFSCGFGYGIFPPITGWLYDQTKSFLTIFTATAAFFFISLIITSPSARCCSSLPGLMRASAVECFSCPRPGSSGSIHSISHRPTERCLSSLSDRRYSSITGLTGAPYVSKKPLIMSLGSPRCRGSCCSLYVHSRPLCILEPWSQRRPAGSFPNQAGGTLFL